jgi:hypothetical protein
LHHAQGLQGNKLFIRIFADKTHLMRAIITFCMLCFIYLSVSAQSYILPAEIPFKLLDVQGNIHLELIFSDKTQLEFVGDTVPEQLSIEWSDGTLSLKSNTEIKKTPAIQVKLYLESLSDLEFTRGAVVQSADILKVSILTLKADTGGKAELTIDADSVSARVNQGSDIILRGSTRSQSIHAITMGNYLAYELEAANTWVKANTGAQVKVNTSEYLNANSKSGAFVGYSGKPNHTTFKNSTGGKITQENQ